MTRVHHVDIQLFSASVTRLTGLIAVAMLALIVLATLATIHWRSILILLLALALVFLLLSALFVFGGGSVLLLAHLNYSL